MKIGSISPALAYERMQKDRSVELIDVRERWEHEYARIPGATLIPLDTIMTVAGTLSPDKEYIVYCHHGYRSYHACKLMARAGLRVVNLSGGIDLWAKTVDSNLPLY